MHFWESNEFWNTIIGVLAGGIITILAQRFDHAHDSKTRKLEAIEKAVGTGKALLLKLSRIQTGILGIAKHINNEFKKVESHPNSNPSSLVLPLMPIPDSLSYTEAETELVFSFGNDELLNKYADIVHVHNFNTRMMSRYGELRAELRKHMPVVSMENSVGTSALTSSQWGYALPIIAELDSLIGHVGQNINKDASDATKVLNLFVSEFNSKFSLKLEVQSK
jgi:hypothetical protein